MRSSVCLAVFALLCLASPAHSQGDAGSLHLLGFTDFNYLATDQPVAQGFREGQLAGHLTAGLTDRITFFAEVTATATAAGFNLEVERTVLRYDVLDALKLSAGRYHTPVSYWNTAYHHGQWLQTSVARPELIRGGGAVLPVHFVGVMAEGSFPTGPLGLGYAAGIGNGRHTHIGRAGDAGDANSSRAWVVSGHARPPRLFGLQVGGSVYGDRISVPSRDAVDERIVSAHLAWSRETPELLAEYARVLHRPRGGETTRTDAYYAQLGYRLPGGARALKPYLRAERVAVSEDDPVFAAAGLDREVAIAGIRYDFAPVAALKAEYRRERLDSPELFNTLALQLSFTFGGSHQTAVAHGAPETTESDP
ncbi:MAG TPA: hypothetical protein VGR37_24420 [Longimicrobiaceae bacterium]|nr:hypothetical protein [Longimicrobiaceae bacterium]